MPLVHGAASNFNLLGPSSRLPCMTKMSQERLESQGDLLLNICCQRILHEMRVLCEMYSHQMQGLSHVKCAVSRILELLCKSVCTRAKTKLASEMPCENVCYGWRHVCPPYFLSIIFVLMVVSSQRLGNVGGCIIFGCLFSKYCWFLGYFFTTFKIGQLNDIVQIRLRNNINV